LASVNGDEVLKTGFEGFFTAGGAISAYSCPSMESNCLENGCRLCSVFGPCAA
jgi:hypothetical protein